MWSARNVTRPGDGTGPARTSFADSSYALRNVRWTIAMSRTSIGCSVDIHFPSGLNRPRLILAPGHGSGAPGARARPRNLLLPDPRFSRQYQVYTCRAASG